jgi:hypothetical protein
MARAGWDVLIVSFDNAAGSLLDMSQYVWEINGFDREAFVQETTAAGDDDEQHAATGVKKVNPITIKGAYDDTASTGPDVVFNAVGNTTTRTLTVTWKSGKTSSVETVIRKYMRGPTRKEFTTYEVELQPTGIVTEV